MVTLTIRSFDVNLVVLISNINQFTVWRNDHLVEMVTAAENSHIGKNSYLMITGFQWYQQDSFVGDNNHIYIDVRGQLPPDTLSTAHEKLYDYKDKLTAFIWIDKRGF